MGADARRGGRGEVGGLGGGRARTVRVAGGGGAGGLGGPEMVRWRAGGGGRPSCWCRHALGGSVGHVRWAVGRIGVIVA